MTELSQLDSERGSRDRAAECEMGPMGIPFGDHLRQVKAGCYPMAVFMMPHLERLEVAPAASLNEE